MSDEQNLSTSSRKDEHILLAQKSVLSIAKNDSRFYYEPLLSIHPPDLSNLKTSFLGKSVSAPLWVSSMTGGSVNANLVNKQLAEVCSELGLGMGLGSCRPLMESSKYFDDFNLRPILGEALPLIANIGLAQVEKLNSNSDDAKIFFNNLEKLKVDGVFIHINPLQEFLQPEGDRFLVDPLKSINNFIEKSPFKVLLKEVGQGMGPHSVKALAELKIAGFEFGAFGGTNFSKLELLRNEGRQNLNPLCQVGHSAEEMVGFLKSSNSSKVKDLEIIVSGGITNFLDAHYLMEKLDRACFYGMAGKVLSVLSDGQVALESYLKNELEGLSFSRSFLRLKG
jgi:isopentenyl-diphosphate Delta-isomerase